MLKYIVLLLLPLSGLKAATLSISSKFFVLNGEKFPIAKLSDVRSRAKTSSSGPRMRSDCYKEYASTSRGIPRTVSYEILKPLNTELVDKITFELPGAGEKVEKIGRDLKNILRVGCETKEEISILITGVLQNGKEFKSQLHVDVDHFMGVDSGPYSYEIHFDDNTYVELFPTELSDEEWALRLETHYSSIELERRNF